MELPWAPLYTIERSGLPEVTVSGIISVTSGPDKDLLTVGDVNALLWSRSVLKPWQLLSHLPELKANYPKLEPHHFALMMSSHSAEPFHLEAIQQMQQLGGIDEELLKCPPAFPMSAEFKYKLMAQGAKPKSLYNGCSGKHTGYLLDLKARNADLENYLQPDGQHFVSLKRILSWFTGRQSDDLPHTIDGCRLPNYPFTAREIGLLYGAILQGIPRPELKTVPSDIAPHIECWDELGKLMTRYPMYIGGTDRLDSRLMSGELTEDKDLSIVAKEGAEGLLAIGINNSRKYPAGLGILIKVASGYDVHHMEKLATELLQQLGLAEPAEPDERFKHLQSKFYFKCPAYQKA